MKLDLHCHILPKKWPDLKERYGYGGWIKMECREGKGHMIRDNGQLFRVVDANTWSLPARLADMNRTDVDVQLLSTVPVMFSYWAKPEDTLDLSRMLNDHMSSCVSQHPDRFLSLATVPLQAPELAARELTRAVTELGMHGVEIGSHVNDWNLDSPNLDPFYKTAEDLGCPIFVHPWDMPMGGRMEKYFLPWLVGMPAETTTAICTMIFGGVFERFPRLRVCFSHGAGAFPYTIGRIEHGYDVRPDLCATNTDVSPRHYLGKFYADSLVHDPKALRLLVDTFGEDKVCLGTDYPFPLGELQPGSLVESMDDFDQALKKKILWSNGLNFLNIEESIFKSGLKCQNV